MLPSQMCRLFQRRELPCIPARQILTDFIKTLQSLLVSFHWAHAQGGSLAPPHLEVGLPRGALAQIRGKGLLPDSQWVCGWSEPEPWSVIQHRVKKNKHHLQQDELHRWLADGFLGIWALGKEHCTDAKKREAEKALTSVSQLLPAPTLLHQFVPWGFAGLLSHSGIVLLYWKLTGSFLPPVCLGSITITSDDLSLISVLFPNSWPFTV